MPILPPVATHGEPTGLCALDAHAHDIPCTRDVADQNQVEVTEAVDCEPDPSLFSARDPAKLPKNQGEYFIKPFRFWLTGNSGGVDHFLRCFF